MAWLFCVGFALSPLICRQVRLCAPSHSPNTYRLGGRSDSKMPVDVNVTASVLGRSWTGNLSWVYPASHLTSAGIGSSALRRQRWKIIMDDDGYFHFSTTGGPNRSFTDQLKTSEYQNCVFRIWFIWCIIQAVGHEVFCSAGIPPHCLILLNWNLHPFLQFGSLIVS